MMSQNPVIFFDGVCNLCDAAVQLVLKHDRKKVFRFSTLQGEYARSVLPASGVEPTEINSIILIEKGKLYRRSAAALRIARHMNGLWPLLYGFIVVPTVFRDMVYNWIARNRYRWWGRKEQCWMPSPELKSRFLD